MFAPRLIEKKRATAYGEASGVTAYLLLSLHAPQDCNASVSACVGTARRRELTAARCSDAGHLIWWKTRAISARDALAVVPEDLRESTMVIPVA